MARLSTNGHGHFAARDLFDTLSALPLEMKCRRCGLKLVHFDATFFSAELHEQEAWTLALPFCPSCDRDVLPSAGATRESALPKIQKIT